MTTPFYITTPIYYVNDLPHLGHAYTTIVADALARFHRMRGDDTRFLTGTDEHGQKIEEAATKRGLTPQQLVDQVAPRFDEAWKALGIEGYRFIRTTDAKHKRVVVALWNRIRERNPDDIYLATYQGWYCVACEAFYTESQLVKDGDGWNCAVHKKPVAWIDKERSWFFRLSKYRDQLLAHFKANPDFVRPRSVYNEMMALLEEGLDDFSISRTKFDWGIPIPDGGVIYVWFDALLNYITALGWSKDDALFKEFWPATVQLVGKEIARFHTIIWPAVLWAIGELPPQQVFAHGWITLDGQKIGKSLGNAVDPFALAEKFGADSLRYFLLREAPFGSDFSYSEAKIAQRHNNDLGNDFGNLVRRSLAMLQKYRSGVVPARSTGSAFATNFAGLPLRAREQIFALDFRGALESIWELVSALNRAIDDQKPWTLFKEERHDELDALLYDLCEGLRWLAMLLAPVMPERTREIWRQLAIVEPIDADWETITWGGIEPGTTTQPGEALFPRIELAPA